MEQQELVNELIASYRKLFAEQSAKDALPWAQTKRNNPNEFVSPTIPFVGKNYATQKTKILLYASAENLSGYLDPKNGGWLDNDEEAINRHRKWFDKYSEGRFFPDVHLKPIKDGRRDMLDLR